MNINFNPDSLAASNKEILMNGDISIHLRTNTSMGNTYENSPQNQMFNIIESNFHPSYNSEEYISDTIQSVIKQTYKDWEMIIEDDFSSDNSYEHIKETFTQSKYPFKIVRHTQNKGVAESRNTIIKLAKGEFIAFFDDDDFSYPKRLERQLLCILEYE